MTKENEFDLAEKVLSKVMPKNQNTEEKLSRMLN